MANPLFTVATKYPLPHCVSRQTIDHSKRVLYALMLGAHVSEIVELNGKSDT